ncbi:MAG: Wzz/FepE/Etk N-terminal domain-containing protein [Ginsengibacter sp.]
MVLEDDDRSRNKNAGNPVINSVISFIKFVFKNWIVVVIVGIVAGILGVVYSTYKMPEYKSRLTFALDDADNGGGIANIMNIASQFGLNFGSSKDLFSGDNILEIMRSRRMIERVLLSVDTFSNKPYTLIEYYLEKSGKRNANSKIKDIHFPPGQPRSDFSYQQDSLLYKTYQAFSEKNVVAQRPDRKLSIYEVNVISPDEKFTKDFTDRIVAETNNFYVEIRTKKAKETLVILEDRATAMKNNLNLSITNKAAVQDVNINPAFSNALVPVQKQQANIQVYGAAYGELFKNLELARFQYLNGIPLMQIIDPANYPMEKIKSGKLKMAIIFALLAELLTLFIIATRNLFRDTDSPK